jgi:hypothetical protein
LRINEASRKEARKEYPNVFAKLHDALPKSVYPITDAAPDEAYYGAPLYPGRLLLGTNDGALIWAYLRKMSLEHVDHCQPVMIRLLTKRGLEKGGMGKEEVEREARREFVGVHGEDGGV